MSELEIALLHAGLVAITLVTATDFELRTGEIPNLVPLASLVLGLVAGGYTGTFWPALGGAAVLGVPAIVAYTREALRPDAAKLALGLGACLGLTGAGVTLVLGAVWVWALAARRDSWKKLHKPMPRLAAAPRISVLAAIGTGAGLVQALAG